MDFNIKKFPLSSLLFEYKECMIPAVDEDHDPSVYLKDRI